MLTRFRIFYINIHPSYTNLRGRLGSKHLYPIQIIKAIRGTRRNCNVVCCSILLIVFIYLYFILCHACPLYSQVIFLFAFRLWPVDWKKKLDTVASLFTSYQTAPASKRKTMHEDTSLCTEWYFLMDFHSCKMVFCVQGYNCLILFYVH